jgi:hypothetical protein
VLKWLAQALKIFRTQTRRLQGKAKFGHHGAIWEALPAMEYLLGHLEQLKARTPQSEPRLWECVNNAWSKMTRYDELTNKSYQIYAAATFLNPTQAATFSVVPGVEGFSPGLRLCWLITEMFGTEITHLAPRKKVGGRDAFEE